jgi:GR25 family glycosyltransferase involved in LPS biosynthesis
VQIHYINLDRRKDRNESLLRTNAGIAEFHRSAAVEGTRLRTEDLIRDGVIHEPLKAFTPGTLGSALSHKKLWDYAIARAAPVTIAEDDVVLNKHFADKAAATLTKLPADWDVMLWGWNFDSILHVEVIEGIKDTIMTFDSTKLESKLLEFQTKNYDVQPLRLLNAFGIMCYTLSPKGARLLGEVCFPLRNEVVTVPGLKRRLLSFTIDVTMNKYYRSLRSYVCFPPLAWSENDKSQSDNQRA